MTFQRPCHEWLANAEDTISTLQKEGAHVVRFPFRLDDFLACCEEHYCAPDAQARATLLGNDLPAYHAIDLFAGLRFSVA